MKISVFALLLGFTLWNYLVVPLNVIIIVFGIGFLILIHELGHFIIAKREKVKVETFALGFGRPIFTRRWGDTDYRINILPLGGYVKMKGELPGEESTGTPDEFNSKKPGQRARILLAGVTMNAIFGLIAAIVAFQFGVRFISPIIGHVEPGGPAWHAGIKSGDLIVEVEGRKIDKFKDLFNAVAFGEQDKPVHIKLRRGRELISCDVVPKYDEEKGFPTIKVMPVYEFRISDKHGVWRILKIGDREIRNNEELYSAIGQAEKSLKLTLQRGSEIRYVEVEPKKFQKVHLMGISNRLLKIKDVRKKSTAEQLGFCQGDILLTFNSKFISNREMLTESLEKFPDGVITVERNGKQHDISLTGITNAYEFLQDFCFTADLYIGKTIPNSPASKIIEPGDRLIKIDSKNVTDWKHVIKAVSEASSGKKVRELKLTLQRGDRVFEESITPEYEEPVYFEEGIQVLPQMTSPQRHGVLTSCKYGIIDAKEMVMEVFLMFKGLFTRRISPKNLGGPISIFVVSHTYLQMFGIVEFIYFLALISINLAVLNLLPIPVLDGGHMVFVTLEKLLGRPVPEKIVIRANYVGFMLLMGLILYVTFNDVVRWFIH